MKGAFLGPSYNKEEIENSLLKCGAKFESLDDDTIIKATAKALVDGKAIGWFQDRMEFGPRALGVRSILGDARNPRHRYAVPLQGGGSF